MNNHEIDEFHPYLRAQFMLDFQIDTADELIHFWRCFGKFAS